MPITFDPAKRDKTQADRGLNFEDAPKVFAGVTLDIEDTRKDYGETRMICFGYLDGRMVVVGYTTRDTGRHIFSMRKANEREQSASRRSLKSDMTRVDSHVIKAHEYDELPELTEEDVDARQDQQGWQTLVAEPAKIDISALAS